MVPLLRSPGLLSIAPAEDASVRTALVAHTDDGDILTDLGGTLFAYQCACLVANIMDKGVPYDITLHQWRTVTGAAKVAIDAIPKDAGAAGSLRERFVVYAVKAENSARVAAGLASGGSQGIESLLVQHCVDIVINTATAACGFYRRDQPRGERRNGATSVITQAPFNFILWQLLLLASSGIVCGRVNNSMATAITAGGLIYSDPAPVASMFTMPGATRASVAGEGEGKGGANGARGHGKGSQGKQGKGGGGGGGGGGGSSSGTKRALQPDANHEEEEAQPERVKKRKGGLMRWRVFFRDGTGLAKDQDVFSRTDFARCGFCGEESCRNGDSCPAGFPKKELMGPGKKYDLSGKSRQQLATLYEHMLPSEKRA